jgi:hypothetical protein
MKYLIGCLILSLFMIQGSVSHAETDLDITDTLVYDATYEACSRISSDVFTKHLPDYDRINAGQFPSQKFMDLLYEIRSESVKNAMTQFQFSKESDSLTLIRTNVGFKQALAKCYGSNTQAKRPFARALFAAEKQGKLFAILSILTVSKGIGSGITLIARFISVSAANAVNTTIGAITAGGIAFETWSAKQARAAFEQTCGTDQTSQTKCLTDLLSPSLASNKSSGTGLNSADSPSKPNSSRSATFTHVSPPSASEAGAAMSMEEMMIEDFNKQIANLREELKSTRDSKRAERLETAIRGYQDLIEKTKHLIPATSAQ